MKSAVCALSVLCLLACEHTAKSESPSVSNSETELVEKGDSLDSSIFLNEAPELIIQIDRESAQILNISTYAIASHIRKVQFDTTRQISIDELLDSRVRFQNNKGKFIEIPLRTVIDTAYIE